MSAKKLKDYPDLLTVQDVCEILRVERRTIYRCIQDNSLPSIKIAGKYRIPKSAVAAFLRDIGRKACYNDLSDDSDALHN